MIKGIAILVLTGTMVGLLYLVLFADSEERRNVVESVEGAAGSASDGLQSAADNVGDAARSVREDPKDSIPVETKPALPDEELAVKGFLERIARIRPDAARTNSDNRVIEMRVFNMDIFDADLEFIGKMTELEVLLLNETKVTDRGMKYLSKLSKLRELDVSSTKVTGRGLIPIRGLRNIEKMSLAFNDIRDGDGVVIAEFRGLKQLSLTETKIGDKGVVALGRLKNLKQLDLYNAPVMEKTIEQFERARPGLKIKR